MSSALVLVLGLGVITLAVSMFVLYLKAETHSSAVLPSHYDVRNYSVDPANLPGWCSNCERMNDTDYRFCENCASELPDLHDYQANRTGLPAFRQD